MEVLVVENGNLIFPREYLEVPSIITANSRSGVNIVYSIPTI